MKFIGLVWGNLKRRKLRTILTVLSVAVAFLLFGFLCTIKEAFTAGVTLADAERVFVRHKVSLIQSLPHAYQARIASIDGVKEVTHQTWFGGIYQDPKEIFPTFPVDPASFMEMYPEYDLPEAQLENWLKTRTGAIVGRTTANNFKLKIGDRIPLRSPIWGEPANQASWQFDIVGIFDSDKKSADLTPFFFHYDYFDEGRQRGKGEVGWYLVRVEHQDLAPSVAKAIDEEFANSPYETKAEAEGAFAQSFVQQIGDIGKIMIGILSAVFFTILLVAGNTMSQAVRERTEELGVLKALGYTNLLVLILVLAESCVIAILGGFSGLGIAWLIIAAGNPVPAMLPIYHLPPKDLLFGASISIVLGLIAGAVPALQAMRLRIAEALRRG